MKKVILVLTTVVVIAASPLLGDNDGTKNSQESFVVILTSDGFTKNEKPAATVYFGEGERRFFKFTAGKVFFRKLKTGDLLSMNRKNNWRAFSLTRTWDGAECVQSSKHDTFAKTRAEKVDQANKKILLTIKGRCVDIKNLTTKHNFEGRITILGDAYKVLVR